MHHQHWISWDRKWWSGWGDDCDGHQRTHGRWLWNGVLRIGQNLGRWKGSLSDGGKRWSKRVWRDQQVHKCHRRYHQVVGTAGRGHG